MSQSLGEKLRLAREERGISITEVAEATRISPHYLQAIEVDDYRTLPGGIFNKGFIKSFAKYVGVDEQSALADYARIMNADGDQNAADEPLNKYRPEVLTDDRARGSMIPTVIGAVVILAIVTAAVLFGLNYLQNRQAQPVANASSTAPNSNTNAGVPASTPAPTVPDMASLKVDFTTTTEAVSLTSTVDGKTASSLVEAGKTVTFEPKESLSISYYRGFAKLVELAINGKKITLPDGPAKGKNSIELVLNKDNLAQIWNSASFVSESVVPTPGETATPDSAPASTPSTAPTATPVTEASPARTPVAPKSDASPAATVRPGANTNAGPKPAATQPRRPSTAANANPQ